VPLSKWPHLVFVGKRFALTDHPRRRKIFESRLPENEQPSWAIFNASATQRAHMRRAYFVCLFLSLTSTFLLSQSDQIPLIKPSATSPQTASTPAKAQTQAELRSIVWRPNHPGWVETLIDGVWFRTVYDVDGIGVEAAVGKLDHYSAAVVTIFNHSLSRIEVRPEMAYLYELSPKERRFNEIDAIRVEKSIGRRTAFKAGLVGFLGGLGSTRTVQQQGPFEGDVHGMDANGMPINGTVSGTYQGTQRVTDPEAQARATEAARAVRDRGTSLQGAIALNALLPNTLKPGQSLQGMIFFERASEKQMTTFNIVIDDKLYVLPFWFK
jgi:hypothetical protein